MIREQTTAICNFRATAIFAYGSVRLSSAVLLAKIGLRLRLRVYALHCISPCEQANATLFCHLVPSQNVSRQERGKRKVLLPLVCDNAALAAELHASVVYRYRSKNVGLVVTNRLFCKFTF